MTLCIHCVRLFSFYIHPSNRIRGIHGPPSNSKAFLCQGPWKDLENAVGPNNGSRPRIEGLGFRVPTPAMENQDSKP